MYYVRCKIHNKKYHLYLLTFPFQLKLKQYGYFFLPNQQNHYVNDYATINNLLYKTYSLTY